MVCSVFLPAIIPSPLFFSSLNKNRKKKKKKQKNCYAPVSSTNFFSVRMTRLVWQF